MERFLLWSNYFLTNDVKVKKLIMVVDDKCRKYIATSTSLNKLLFWVRKNKRKKNKKWKKIICYAYLYEFWSICSILKTVISDFNTNLVLEALQQINKLIWELKSKFDRWIIEAFTMKKLYNLKNFIFVNYNVYLNLFNKFLLLFNIN